MLIVGNTKAFIRSKKEAETLIRLYGTLQKSSRHSLVLALPHPFLLLKKGETLRFASQNVSEFPDGAHTGEVVASVLKDAGAQYSIAGHSERRAKGETNDVVREKVTQLLAKNIIPILCIGESERSDDGEYLDVILEQISSAFTGRTIKEMSSMVVAYEPVWAIGKETAPTPELIYETVLYIRKIINRIEPLAAKKVRVIYGGSVDSTDVKMLAQDAGVDGFLLGRASANPEEMKLLMSILNEVRR